ncbi:prefoldin subunit 1-like [Tubulanus polymorphus]|uniref:prefoldin subunit 1-like n=1 Tax=Tubulanus polymorphus TaxID=672921 RepID=UPI003DA4E8D9
MAAKVDEELKRAFQELQQKMITTTQQLKVSDMQIETLKRQITHKALVEQELSKLSDDTKTYEGVGRMFILQPMPVVKSHLEKKVKVSEEKIKTIESQKVYLERNMKESEDNLRELVMAKQQARS